MKSIKKALALALLAGGSMFAQTRFSIGIGIGTPAPRYYAPRAYAVAPVYDPYYMPPAPGPGYTWIAGYWGPRRAWVPGYWRAPVYGRRVYAAPRYYVRGHVYRR